MHSIKYHDTSCKSLLEILVLFSMNTYIHNYTNLKRVLLFYLIIHLSRSKYEDFHEIDLAFRQPQLHSKAKNVNTFTIAHF